MRYNQVSNYGYAPKHWLNAVTCCVIATAIDKLYLIISKLYSCSFVLYVSPCAVHYIYIYI